MSRWVIDDSAINQPPVQQTASDESSAPQNKWVLDASQINAAPAEEESKLKSAIYAGPRVLKDAVLGGLSAVESIPKYYEQAKTEVPGLISLLEENPSNAARFFTKGVGQTVNNALQAGPALTNYLTNRLHLFPEDWNKHIQRGAKEIDFSEGLNKSFGEPTQPGEALASGLGGNAIFGVPGAKVADSALKATAIPAFNALTGRLGAENIANSIVKTLEKNKRAYSKKFNEMLSHAEESRHNAPVSLKGQMQNMYDLRKELTRKEAENINEFVANPTLENAHAAKSDMLALQRKYQARIDRKDHLFGSEKAAKNALDELIPHIKENMFFNKNGLKNILLAESYEKLQKHYKNHVVPYFGVGIEDYTKGDLLASDLLKQLQSDKLFRARKLSTHSRIGQRNALLKALVGGLGVGGAYEGYKYLKPEGNSLNVAPPIGAK